MRQLVYICILACFVVSCSKETLLSESPSLIGKWRHYSATDAWENVIVNSDGTGKVEYFRKSKIFEETKVKDWYTEDNRMYLGKATFSLQPYTITSYPQLASFQEIIEFDTLKIGIRYIQLNQLNFVEFD